MDQVASLSKLLGLQPAALQRHLQTPLARPHPDPLAGWRAPEVIRSILVVCDGFRLFWANPEDSFRLWGAEDYGDLRRHLDPIWPGSQRLGVLPIFGGGPHLTSVRIADGAVIATDWEDENGKGWCRKIADSVQEYIATVIQVREAYGDGEWPSDWWHLYATLGTRYDLDRE